MASKEKLYKLVETILVPHSGYMEARSQIQQLYDVSGIVDDPVGLPLLGESRNGKSRVIKELVKCYPSSRNAEGLIVPILSVKTPPKPTLKGLVEALLSKMGDPNPHAGTENDMTDRLKKLTSTSGTRVVVLDEFQHFVEKSSMNVQEYLVNWLKNFLEESMLPVIVVGLETATAVLDQDQQLRGRFLAPVRMSRFDWNEKEQRSEFVAVLDSFETALREYFDLPELANEDMAFRLYVATGGLIGYLTALLKKWVWNAVSTDSRTLTLADLSKAYKQSIGKHQDAVSSAGNPFISSFPIAPTEANLAAAKEVGKPRMEKTQRPRKSRAKKRTSASAALRAA